MYVVTDNSTKFPWNMFCLIYVYSLSLSLLIGVKQAPKPSGADRNVSVDSPHPTKKPGKE